MKKIITTTLAAGLVASSAMAGASVTTDFASAYVFRGTTFNDGFVIQPGVEADGLGLPEEYGSFAVGAWGNIDVNDPYNGGQQTSQFTETDWYGSYGLPTLVEGLDLSIGYTEYTYPLAGGSADKEVSAGAGFDLDGLALGGTVYQLIGGSFVGDTWYEVSAGYSMDASEDLSVGVSADARFLDSRGGKSGFNDYTVGADASYAINDVWGIGASITYIGQGDDAVLADYSAATATLGYDVDVVGMLSVGASF